MKFIVILTVCLFSGIAFSQNDSLKPQVLKADDSNSKLLDSPESQVFDGSSITIQSGFWHNGMPMSNHNATYWTVDLNSAKHSSLPPEIEPRKCYLFIGASVYMFSYNNGFISDKSIRIPQTPREIVVEYLDKRENKIKYIRQRGPFLTDYVE